MAFNEEKFGKAWERVQELMGKTYGALIKTNASSEVIMKTLIDLDMQTLVFEEFGLNGEINAINARYIETLKGLEPFAKVTEASLQTLIQTDMIVYKSKILEQSELMRKLMIESVIGKQSEAQFASKLVEVGMRPDQANSLVNDSLRKFSRNVSREMANKAPKSKLYIYEGPIDDRTSDDCMEILAAGPLTLEDIDSRFPGTFTAGTHFGCRHEYHPYTTPAQYGETAIRGELKVRASA